MQNFVRKTASRILRDRTDDMGLDEKAVAKKIGMSRSTYRRRLKDPGDLTVRELKLLGMALGFNKEELLDLISGC